MKLTNIRKQLAERELDGILISSPYNRRYVTNFTGTAGVALITADEALFITDFRYTNQAKDQAKAFTIIEHEQLLIDEIAHQVKKLQIKRLGFEAAHTAFSTYELYTKELVATLVPVTGMIEKLREIKTEEELSILQAAAKIADDAFAHILSFIKPGVKEIDIANELEFFMRKQGATSSSFDTIVASGWRSALPHGVASSKEIQHGELVTLDFGALYQGYVSDITRTVAVGEISNELKEIYETVLAAENEGIKHIKAGMTGKEADDITRNYIADKGYGAYFGHSTGHGIGLEVHEGPSLSQRSETILEANMVVTVEPGIYIPEIGGCRIEDDIVITETGNRRLTKAKKELIHL